MKSFKQYLLENSEYVKLNKVLQDYVNGDMPDDFDNEQENPKELFKQIYGLFDQNGTPLIIMKGGTRFEGNGIVLKTSNNMHFDLASESEENIIPYRLHVELKQNDNGDYFFTFLKVEPK